MSTPSIRIGYARVSTDKQDLRRSCSSCDASASSGGGSSSTTGAPGRTATAKGCQRLRRRASAPVTSSSWRSSTGSPGRSARTTSPTRLRAAASR